MIARSIAGLGDLIFAVQQIGPFDRASRAPRPVSRDTRRATKQSSALRFRIVSLRSKEAAAIRRRPPLGQTRKNPYAPQIDTAAKNANGSAASTQIVVTQTTLSNSGASSREIENRGPCLSLTNAITLTPQCALGRAAG